jgi:hypothetical protein
MHVPCATSRELFNLDSFFLEPQMVKGFEAEEDLITQAEAARLRGVTRSAIGYLIAQGRLQTHERYGLRFVSKRAVLEYEPLKPGPVPKAKPEQNVKKRGKK